MGCGTDAAYTQPNKQQQQQQQQHVLTATGNKSNQIIIRGKCEDKDATFFVDTGSAVSLVSKCFIDLLGLTDQIERTNVTLSSFTSDRIKTYGELTLEVVVANCRVKHRMIITDLIDSHFLLGLDFLSLHQMNVDVTHRCITSIKGSSKFLPSPKQLQNRSRIKCAKTYTVPASSVMFIKAKTTSSEILPNYSYSGFVEPKVNLLLDQGLLIDSGMCLTNNKQLPIRIMNLTDSPIQLYKNKDLGNLYPIDINCDSDIRGVQPENATTDQVNRVTKDSLPTSKEENEAKEWTKTQLWNELRIDEIKDITEGERNRLKDLLWKYRQCFSTGPFDLGKCNMYQADITLKPDYKPSWIPARPVPYKLRAKMDEQIKGLENAGVIERCTEKSLFNSPIFLVKKPHQPDKMRFVCDMRAVNAQCLPDSFQMPLIGHVVDKIAGNKWYSTFDLSQSFHQVEYKKECRHITAFTTSNGTRYWFKRMIMGHKTSGAQFSRCMTKILENLEFLIFFLDDLLCASNNIDTHLSRLEIVLNRLATANMKLSPSKSHFMKKEVNFVGITINSEGLRITDERVKVLMDLKAPPDRKSLQSLLGFFGFNRKWIPQYASLTHCMYRLLRKGVPFKWTQECDTNLQKMKEAVKESITLAVPDLYDRDQSYELVIDGSKVGMGAHLSQIINGKRRIIGYFSKAVPPHKRDWSQTKLELLTLFHAIKFWEPYLKGTTFVVKTDCLSLCRLDVIFAKNDATLRRKIQSLAQYSFKIVHISGASNSISDFWSRFPFKKKFRDNETQCDLNPGKKLVAMVNERDRKLKETITRVSSLCTLQNSKKEVALVPSTEKAPVQDTPEQPEQPEQLEPPGPPILNTYSHSEPVERLIPPGFFSQRRYKNCKVRTVQLEDVRAKHECCVICDDNREEVNTSVNTVDHHVTTGIVSTEENDTELVENQINFNPTISSLSAIQQAQASDSVLSVVKDWLLTGTKPLSIQAYRAPKELVSYWKQFSLLSLKDGMIMRKWISVKNGNKEEDRLLICVPEANQEAVLHMCHTSLVANHPGIKLTLDVCRRYYYWPGMSHDNELYVKACVTCGRAKQPQAYSKAKRQHIIAHEFNQILSIDHIEAEKLGITADKNKYILSMTDVYSGYVVAVATNSQSSDENIRLILHKWVLRFGIPREILSDNAPGFSSQFYRAVLTALHCKNTHGLPYECRTTSKAERSNKRLNSSLRVCLDGKNPKEWDRYLDYVCSALNSLKSRATGYSANFLVFGHELNTPLSLLLENGNHDDVFDPSEPGAFNRKAYDLHNAYRDIVRKVRRNLQTYYEHSDMNFNDSIRNKPFATGDYCFVLIRCPKHKFAPRWYGPVKIVKAVNDHVYVVKIGEIEKVVNISKLKKYTANKYSPPFTLRSKDSVVTKSKPGSPKSPSRTGMEIQLHADSQHEDVPSASTSDLSSQAMTSPNSETTQSSPQIDHQDLTTQSGHEGTQNDGNQSASQSTERPKRKRTTTQPLQIDPRKKSYSTDN